MSSLVRWRGPSKGRIAILASGIAIVAIHAATFPSASSAAYPPSAEGRTMAVASDHGDATRAALDVMAAGGNAADGAVAAALALGVVNPSASGLGGGGFALVYTAADRRVTVLDFRESAPSSFSAELLSPPKKPGDPPPLDRFGWTGPRGGSVGVPGEPAGLELLSRRFGKRSLSDVAAPAVALAHNGFYASARLLFDLDPSACVSHPRVHTQGATLLVDPDLAPDVREGLRTRGETVNEEPFTGSAIQMVAWHRTPGGSVKLLAAADPRKGGLAAAR